jgi:DNA-binding winged helix-turn-helix (wHTH) protein
MTSPSNSSESNNHAKLLRFGVFEMDLLAGELRKNGRRIPLQEQPFQVLVRLIENAGQVVTRDHLRQTIWPADTFVDFDHSLNTAVNKIRESLGDSASSPRFVETLARRGYRFIAPVDCASATEASMPVETAVSTSNPASALTATGAFGDSAHGDAALHPELHVPIPRRGLVRFLFALIQVMFLVFYLSALAHLRGIDGIATRLLSEWQATLLLAVVPITGAIGIPLRCYLISAVAFDFRKLDASFRRLFPFVFVLDQLWGTSEQP